KQIQRQIPLARGELAQPADGAIRSLAQQRELRATIALGARIGEVDDGAAIATLDCGVRRVQKAAQSFREPVIAARLAARGVLALLNHAPVSLAGDDEAVQVQIVTVLDRG